MARARLPVSDKKTSAGDDPVWAAFCAGVDPLARHTPKASTRSAKAASANTHHPILAPIYLPPAESEDFAQLMDEWENGGGQFKTETPKPSAIVPNLAALRPPEEAPKPAKPQTPTLGEWAGVDAATARKLSRGQLPIDAVLDLHGLNLEQAFDSVSGMVQLGRIRGWRLLLVITGKGRPQHTPGLVEGDGKIRRALPRWLADASVAPHVVAAGTAHARHGGTGAYYLLLRRASRGVAPSTVEVGA